MKEWDYDNQQWTRLAPHIKHLPLFTRHFDFFSFCIRMIWAVILKFLFHFYIRLQVVGDYKTLHKNYPRLLIISNHASHLDATAIAASVPQLYWRDLYIAAAKDYFFSNPVFTFFSQHCLGAIPFDRKDKRGESIQLSLTLLTNLKRIWMILFPEGTRSKDGKIHDFKRGVSLFSQKTQTPILFLYLEGNAELWPKGRVLPKPGKLLIHIGPVHPPGPIEQVYANFRKWVETINPNAFSQPINQEEIGTPVISEENLQRDWSQPLEPEDSESSESGFRSDSEE